MDVSAILNGSGTSQSATKNAQDTQDRFLKLLVAQMQNQDPMNPMDNAQVTSQMAQIQTVTGVSTLNTSIQSLSSQFAQMQALQSVSLVGREVTIEGKQLTVRDGKGQGGYELSGAADRVKMEVLSSAGTVIDTVELGAQGAGLHDFSWPADKAAGMSGLQFRITATRGTTAVSSTTYAQDRVAGVNTSGSKLRLQLDQLGLVDYTSIKTVD